MKPVIYKSPRSRSRKIRDSLAEETISAALGDIEPGCEIFGLTGGCFSFIDVLTHCLKYTGAADVVVSTWTAAAVDLERTDRFIKSGSVTSLKFLVDRSFPQRQPECARLLVEKFGRGAVRLARSHAKFALIGSANMKLVIRTSMNLNENRRMESFEISDDAAMYDHFISVVDAMFEEEYEITPEAMSRVRGRKKDGFDDLADWASA